MKHPHLRLAVLSCAAFLLVGSLVSNAAASPIPTVPKPRFSDMVRALGGDTLPGAWAGIWDFIDTDVNCTTGDSLAPESSTDTLCTGDTFDPEQGGYILDCSGSTANDTVINVDCSGTFVILGPCTVTVTFTLDAIRTDEDLEAVVVFMQDYSAACGPIPDTCNRTESTGHRIAPEPAECGTPVEAMTWGRVKAAYR